MPEPPIDPALWNEPEMRAALARRDIPTVYRLVNQSGVSQRTIAKLTGQQQSEVSEILKGRMVIFYDVLVRIADGLGIPRGRMGLAYDQTTAVLLLSPEQLQGLSEAVKRRVLMALATKAVVGEAVLGEAIEAERLASMPADKAPLPARIGKGDVTALRALTDRFRLLGRAGHAGMPDVLTPVARQRERLLTVAADDNVLGQLQSALAELHTLTGWWCYDRHLIDTASWHYDRAIRLACDAGDVIQMVDAAAHAAIGDRELGLANDALKLYQLAQAKVNGLPDAYPGKSEQQAVLHARTAHAYADLGWSEQAHRELEWARQVPSLADPFENAEMDAKLAAIELAVGNLDVA